MTVASSLPLGVPAFKPIPTHLDNETPNNVLIEAQSSTTHSKIADMMSPVYPVYQDQISRIDLKSSKLHLKDNTGVHEMISPFAHVSLE